MTWSLFVGTGSSGWLGGLVGVGMSGQLHVARD